ncbi:hypothetical protein F2Q69_00027916 [Brassica cretica]|uniref:Uncharacterized protein n=1 Tax=Brassica cretica TaxID=69181 RepID=A0A8S9S282_BRACR|nr:hypothetical protein F2Q69_00027916 [Brassica cretica]
MEHVSIDVETLVSIDVEVVRSIDVEVMGSTALFDLWITRSKSSGSTCKSHIPLRLLVHAQQYQKQQGNSTAILIRFCKLGTFDPQRKTLLIINASSSIDTRQQPLTHTSILSTNTHSPPSTEATLPSTDIFQPTSINISSRTSIDTEPRDMFATLVLVRDEDGDLHD